MAETFTPLFDEITQKYGIVTSAVYGYIWRKCQGERGVCNASLQTIADDLGVSRRTVVTHVKLLVDDGAISDLTPDADRKPHKYSIQTREINALDTIANSSLDTPQLGQELPQSRELNAHKDTRQEENTTERAHKRLDRKFLMLTGIDRAQDPMTYSDEWQRPYDIWLERFGNVEAVEKKMETAVSEMIAKGLRFKSPTSLIKTIANEHANGNGRHPNGSNGSAPDKTESLENIRKAVTTYGARQYKQAMAALREPERAIVKNMASSWRDVCMMDKQTFQVKYYQALKGS